MRTTSNGAFQREGKLLVAVLVLAVVCSPATGSRFMKLSAHEDDILKDTPSPPPPPPLRWWQHPPPPPLVLQWPPPIHHYPRHYPPSPPPPLSSPPPPPSPPPPSSSSPPPPPDQVNSNLLNDKHSQNGRRLLSADSETTHFLLTASSPGKCPTDPAMSPSPPPYAPYGGYIVPAGAPYPSSSDPGALSPAPAPTSGADAHTTMVSAMKYNQCTYTIITSTGNIEGAGTQADVNVEFFDKFGDSVLFVNLRSQSRNFDRGATDTFTVVGDCVQNICRMHLSHDDSGPDPGWFVNTVTVSLPYQTYTFNVFEWLAKDEPPYSLSRTISSCPV